MASPKNHEYLWHSNYSLEVTILYSIAALGIALNIFQIICIILEREFRNLLSAFLIHGALINAVLASYCIVFALSLHDKTFKSICKYLGSSFIVIMTANIVNLIAIIATEVYKLSNLENDVQNRHDNHNNDLMNQNNRSGLNLASKTGSSNANVYCILFGLAIVYSASLILHLGPTVIAGNFSFDEKTGFCLFIFGQRKNYVVFVVWIVIVTLVLMASTYYLYSFHVRINKLTMIHQLFLNEMENQSNQIKAENHDTKLELIFTKSRGWTLSCVTGLHVLCWYPLFGLLITDRNFQISIGLYRAFTCLAWSNAFLEPLIYLLLDRKTSRCCLKLFSKYTSTNSTKKLKNNRYLYRKQIVSPLQNDLNVTNTMINMDYLTSSFNMNSNNLIGNSNSNRPFEHLKSSSQIDLDDYPELYTTSSPNSNTTNSLHIPQQSSTFPIISSISSNSLLNLPNNNDTNYSANIQNINYIAC